jgi:hypothetical protein
VSGGTVIPGLQGPLVTAVIRGRNNVHVLILGQIKSAQMAQLFKYYFAGGEGQHVTKEVLGGGSAKIGMNLVR